MKKLLLVASISLLSPIQATSLPKKSLRTLTNGLFYLIASSDASDKTTSQAQDLLKKIDPSKELLAVRKFNRFGKFLFGDHNTITIPYLNYVIVDNEGMESLSEEARKFVLGRCMMTLRHQHKYLIYKYLVPYLGHQVVNRVTTKEERETCPPFLGQIKASAKDASKAYYAQSEPSVIEEKLTAFHSSLGNSIEPLKNETIFLSKNLAIGSASGYLARGIEYELDAHAVNELNCKEGALEYLEKVETLPFTKYLLTLSLICCAEKVKSCVKKSKEKTLTIKALTAWYKSIGYCLKAVKYLPGQNASFYKAGSCYTMRYLGRALQTLNPATLTGTFPYAYKRIDNLTKEK